MSSSLLNSALVKQNTRKIENISVNNEEVLSEDRKREIKTGLTVCKALSFPGKAAQERWPNYSDSGAWKNTA